MKLWPGKRSYYVADDCERILTVLYVKDAFISMAIDIVPLEMLHEWIVKFPELRGEPQFIAQEGGEILMYPFPDKKYDLRIRYQPHVREI